ncbi:hypothetical protein NW768_008090 [Fusarium equiseti]|uniref:Cyanovirin-N domain-containing protein n=1 Tax=Fusarium equiseti TaxID=61235 RepID=A0ABQ8R5R9_FUSEQ|nr:hypothetical protein NW768_008090 [Fusarium equiseti]
MVKAIVLASALLAAVAMAAQAGKAQESAAEMTQASNDDEPIEIQSFMQSCRSCTIYLNLNSCVGNADGWIRWWNNGGFGGSCIHIGVDADSRLRAHCTNNNGDRIMSTLLLNERIHNSRGQMWCGN